ncbi:MAG: ABC transporter permease [Fimbriimonadaceae bacterium]|nr:ABC transporter permease [Fimbriimonadaceae bacterium]
MKRIVGIAVLLAVVVIATSLQDHRFLQAENMSNLGRWVGMYGILSVGEAFVIMTGGIDLSVGSIVGLVGCLLPMLAKDHGLPMPVAILVVLGLSAGLGLIHGLLVTKLKLQPFVVTLCGLFVYRGAARYITGDATQGFGVGYQDTKQLAAGTLFGLPNPFLFLLLIALVASVFLNLTVFGRHLLAVGRNDKTARLSGVPVDRVIITTYVVSALAAGFGGVLFALDLNSVQPSGHGNFFELYAIAGAVLGSCSLRGGYGSILGVLIGTAIVRVLYNAINLLGIATQLEFAVIGAVILIGVLADELVRRAAAMRKTSARSP